MSPLHALMGEQINPFVMWVWINKRHLIFRLKTRIMDILYGSKLGETEKKLILKKLSNENKIICNSCVGEIIKLMADISSSGLWCGGCGAMVDGEDLGIPKELEEEIQIWNDRFNYDPSNDEYTFPADFNEQGLKLAKKIAKYRTCYLFIHV
jgi:hypothetical protein